MSMIIHAIYEHGVFRPIDAVEIPEKPEIAVEVRVVKEGPRKPSLDDVYANLSEWFDSAEPEGAERYNEHQP
jgi:predicted DNA-binding antitoxin AbrB/MazE fold protein